MLLTLWLSPAAGLLAELDFVTAVISFAEFKAVARNFWWLAIVLFPAILLGHHFYERLNQRGRTSWWLLTGGLVLAISGILAGVVWTNYRNPPEFDFQLYWIYGRVATQGKNPYDFEQLNAVAQTLELSEELRGELFYLQSPPALFLFAPLGWFGVRTACLLWQLFHSAVLAVAIVWLWRLFPKLVGWHSLLLVAALTLGLRSTMETMRFTQVNFLTLLLFVGFWRWRGRLLGGALLALALIVKPVFFLLPVYLLARRQLAALAGLTLGGVVACLATIATFGPTTFFAYTSANPLARKMPMYFFTEEVNQSLLAAILRLTDLDLTQHSPYSSVPFWLCAASLAAVTGWFVWRLPREDEDWGVAIVLVLSMLLFPKTLSHYTVLLVPPLLLLWVNRQRLPGTVWTATLAVTLVMVLIGAKQATLGMLGTWLTLAVGGFWLSRPGAATLSQSPSSVASLH